MDYFQALLRKIAMPDSTPTASQRGQEIGTSSGYQEAQQRGGFEAPPNQFDFGQAGQMLGSMKQGLSDVYSRFMTPAPAPTQGPKMWRQPTNEVIRQVDPEVMAPIQRAATPAPTAMPTANPGSRSIGIDPQVVEIATPIFEKYGIPLQVGFGQMAEEGRAKHKYAQAPYHNPLNLGAYDRNPDGAFKYENLEKGIEAYAKLLSGQYELGHIGSGKFDKRYTDAYKLKDNPEEMMRRIAEIGYASNPKYLDNIVGTPEWEYFKR